MGFRYAQFSQVPGQGRLGDIQSFGLQEPDQLILIADPLPGDNAPDNVQPLVLSLHK